MDDEVTARGEKVRAQLSRSRVKGLTRLRWSVWWSEPFSSPEEGERSCSVMAAVGWTPQ
jgi:hypothetical protein